CARPATSGTTAMGATPRRSPLKEAVLATDWAPTVHRTKPARRARPLARRTGYLADASAHRRPQIHCMPRGLPGQTGSTVEDARNDPVLAPARLAAIVR